MRTGSARRWSLNPTSGEETLRWAPRASWRPVNRKRRSGNLHAPGRQKFSETTSFDRCRKRGWHETTNTTLDGGGIGPAHSSRLGWDDYASRGAHQARSFYDNTGSETAAYLPRQTATNSPVHARCVAPHPHRRASPSPARLARKACASAQRARLLLLVNNWFVTATYHATEVDVN